MPIPAVFISAKSDDYGYARQVYTFLVAQGFPCFFSDESLMVQGEADYKDAIDSAIDVAPHLVVVTSSRAHAESKWVKYEWNTFSNELLSGRKTGNLLTIACGELQPGDLPLALRQKQVLPLEGGLPKLPRFLPGARVSEPSLGAVVERPGIEPSYLQALIARWLPPAWTGALTHRRRDFVFGYALVIVTCYLVMAFASAVTTALQARGVPEFPAACAGFLVLAPAVTAYFAATQWFAQLRVPESRYWWAVMAVGGFFAEILRAGVYQILTHLFTQRWGEPTFWWSRAFAIAGYLCYGLVFGLLAARYFRRCGGSRWQWVSLCMVAGGPVNLLSTLAQEGLKRAGVPPPWAGMGSVAAELWIAPIFAFALWQGTRGATSAFADPWKSRLPAGRIRR